MSILSDLLLICISLIGFGYVVSGKPKSKYLRYTNKHDDNIVYKKSNFTKKIIKTFLIILCLYFFVLTIKY